MCLCLCIHIYIHVNVCNTCDFPGIFKQCIRYAHRRPVARSRCRDMTPFKWTWLIHVTWLVLLTHDSFGSPVTRSDATWRIHMRNNNDQSPDLSSGTWLLFWDMTPLMGHDSCTWYASFFFKIWLVSMRDAALWCDMTHSHAHGRLVARSLL